MPVDNNVYALSIQLQLESAAAFKTMDDFGQAAEDVEERISKAAQDTINSLVNVTNVLNQNLSKAISNTQAFESSGSKLESTLSRAADSIRDARDTQSDSIKDLEDRLKILEDIEEIQEKLEKSLDTEHETGQEYLKLIDKWSAALETKNAHHVDEKDLVAEEYSLVQDMSDYVRILTGNWTKLGRTTRSILDSLTTMWQLIKLIDSETENFVTANFRIYGSQQQIVNQTRVLSNEYGVFRKEAIETYKALANVRTPRDEIEKLAKTVAFANRVTGLGIDVLAQYSFTLRGAGFDADRTRKQIDMLSAAQRKFGLSTYDTQRAIEAQTLSVGQQIIHFGKDAPEAFMKASLGLKALDKQLGTNAAEEWMKRLQLTGIESEVFWDKFGIDASASIAEKFDSISRAVSVAAQEAGVSIQNLAEGNLTKAQRDELKIIAGVYGITEEMMYANAKAQMNLTAAQRANMMTMDGISKSMKAQIDADKRWRESMNTLTAQLNIMKAAFAASMGIIMQWLADAILPVVTAINDFNLSLNRWFNVWFKSIGGFEKLKKVWAGFLEFISPAIDVIQDIFDSLKDTTKGVIDSITDILNQGSIDIPELFKTMGSGVFAILGGLFGNIGIKIIAPIFNSMWEAAQKYGPIAFNKIIDWIGWAFNSIVDLVKEYGPLIWQATVELFQKLVAIIVPAIKKYGPPVLDAMMEFGGWVLKKLWEGFLIFMPWLFVKLIEFGGWVITKIGEGLLASIPWLLEKIWQLATELPVKLWAGFISVQQWLFTKLIEFGGWVINKLWDGLLAVIPWLLGKIFEFSKSIVETLWKGIQTMAGWVIGKVTGFFNDILDIFNPAKMFKIGKDIVIGMKRGIVSKWNEVKDFFADSWKWIKDKMNPFAKASPSMVDMFISGFDEMKNVTSEFGTNAISAWKNLRQRADIELVAMRSLIADLATNVNEAYASTQGLFSEFYASLNQGSGKISSAVKRLKAPINALMSVFNILASGLESFSSHGIAMMDDIDKLGGMLEKYATLLENAAARIETAVFTKAVPAMMAAGDAGIDEVIKSEAITQIQVTTTDGNEKDDEKTTLLTEQLSILKRVDNKLGAIVGSSDTQITAILELLQSFLPQLVEKDAGLASEMNQWMK